MSVKKAVDLSLCCVSGWGGGVSGWGGGVGGSRASA